MRLTSGPLSLESPQPSTDGKKIFAVGSQMRAELVRYDSKAAQFLPFLSGISVSNLDFSPDGNWISYVTLPEGELWRSRVDGSEKLQLTSAPLFVEAAQWSPDGRQLVFTGMQPGAREHVFLVSAVSGALRQVGPADGNFFAAGSTPGGNSILVAEVTSPEKSSLRFLDLKTNQMSLVPDSRGRIASRLSPDGRFIAATSVDGQQIYLFEVATQHWSELVKESVGSMHWSQDSQYLYYDTQSTAEPAIHRVHIADHKVEPVASLKNFRRVLLSFQPWMGLTPDSSPSCSAIPAPRKSTHSISKPNKIANRWRCFINLDSRRYAFGVQQARGSRWVARESRFRTLLPIVQCAAAALFGGFGLWQRSAILNRLIFEDQTLWDTTARFHVWPWPFKFAVVINTPAFLAWSLVGWPIGDRWPMIPEGAMCAPSLLFVAILWYAVGRWLDRRWYEPARPATHARRPWELLFLFTLTCAVGASIHSTTAYLLWGAIVWLLVGIGVGLSSARRRFLLRGE